MFTAEVEKTAANLLHVVVDATEKALTVHQLPVAVPSQTNGRIAHGSHGAHSTYPNCTHMLLAYLCQLQHIMSDDNAAVSLMPAKQSAGKPHNANANGALSVLGSMTSAAPVTQVFLLLSLSAVPYACAYILQAALATETFAKFAGRVFNHCARLLESKTIAPKGQSSASANDDRAEAVNVFMNSGLCHILWWTVLWMTEAMVDEVRVTSTAWCVFLMKFEIRVLRV